MLRIRYPEPTFRIKTEKEKEYIFDALRKKWLLLTPEEWVRQNFVQYLIQVKEYPASLIAMEKTIKVGEMNKRFDVLVYDRHHQPKLMIECKASSVPLTEDVLHQLLRYHIAVPAGFLFVINGKEHYGWQKRDGQLEPLPDVPSLHEI